MDAVRAYKIGDRAGEIFDVIRGFCSWWIGELASVVPQRLRERISAGRERVVIRDCGEHFSFAVYKGNERLMTLPDISWSDSAAERTIVAATARIDNPEVILVVHKSRVLRTTFTLPRLSRRERNQAVALRAGAELPIVPDAGYFAHEVLEGGDGTDRIALVGALKSDVDALRANLERWGQNPTRVVVNSQTGADMILWTRQRRRQENATGLWVIAAWMPLALMLVALTVYSFRLNGARQDIGVKLAAMSPELQNLARLEAGFEKSQVVTRFLANEMSRPSAAQIIEELTRILPKTAWTNAFQLSDASIRISGFAMNPEDLVGFLESSRLFADVRLGAVSALAGATGAVKYQITMTVEGAPK